MADENERMNWGILTLTGACGLCCVGLAALAGGAAMTGGAAGTAAAGTTAVSSFGGLLVTVLATALPLFVVGLFLRYRARRS